MTTPKSDIRAALRQRQSFILELNGHRYKTLYPHYSTLMMLVEVGELVFFEDKDACLHLGVVSKLNFRRTIDIRALPRGKWVSQEAVRKQIDTIFNVTHAQLLCKLIEDDK